MLFAVCEKNLFFFRIQVQCPRTIARYANLRRILIGRIEATYLNDIRTIQTGALFELAIEACHGIILRRFLL
jgi:hypothetical protein